MKQKNNARNIILSALCTAVVLLSGCSSNANSSSAADSSSKSGSAAPAVTLPTSQSDTSSATDSSNTDEEKSDITPAMWEVTSENGTKITMMGSMHALKTEVYPLPDRMMDAYNNADILAVECDVSLATASFTMQSIMQQHLYYEDKSKVKDHLDEDVYNNVVEYLDFLGQDPTKFEDFQLWYLYSMLDALSVEESGLSTTRGIDLYYLNQAHKDEKEIYEVETVKSQAELFPSLSDDVYKVLLSSYSVESAQEHTDALFETYEAWKTGDIDFFSGQNDVDEYVKEAEKSGTPLTDSEIEALKEFNNALLYDRNKTMATAVETLLEGDKDVFYIVGMAHFPGEGGILDLLEKDGYKVTVVN